MAQTTPDAEQLLTPPSYAKPERIDELMKRSQPRRADRFDLPPPSGEAPALPETQEESSSEEAGPVDPAMSWKPVRKAVFPVAGLGTRLLPATKSMPKEMLTIVDRPLIQYAVDEAREAGIEQLIFVTGRGKAALDDYFDIGFELEATLRERGKSLDSLERSRSQFGEIVSVRQQQPLGLGHAVWCATAIVGDEPFAVLLPDDLMAGKPGALKQMVDAYDELGGNILCTERGAGREDRAATASSRPGEQHGRADRSQRPGREAETAGRAVGPRRHRPLHPAAGDHDASSTRRKRAPAARSS